MCRPSHLGGCRVGTPAARKKYNTLFLQSCSEAKEMRALMILVAYCSAFSPDDRAPHASVIVPAAGPGALTLRVSASVGSASSFRLSVEFLEGAEAEAAEEASAPTPLDSSSIDAGRAMASGKLIIGGVRTAFGALLIGGDGRFVLQDAAGTLTLALTLTLARILTLTSTLTPTLTKALTASCFRTPRARRSSPRRRRPPSYPTVPAADTASPCARLAPRRGPGPPAAGRAWQTATGGRLTRGMRSTVSSPSPSRRGATTPTTCTATRSPSTESRRGLMRHRCTRRTLAPR